MSHCFVFYFYSLMKGTTMKIRHIAALIVVIIAANSVIGGVSNALKRSDYHHCMVTTHYSEKECRVLTGYEGE